MRYNKKKIIDNISSEGVTHTGQAGVTEAITGFYDMLYRAGATVQGDDEFYHNSPTLSNESKAIIISEIIPIFFSFTTLKLMYKTSSPTLVSEQPWCIAPTRGQNINW